MAFNFSRVITKLQNSQLMTRPSFTNGKYIMLPKNTQYIVLIDPTNILNPATPFLCAIDDISANDWIILP